MSCALTIDAVRSRTKTVTRRDPATWTALKPGDRLTLVKKGMGLKKGETQVVLAEVEIVSVWIEPLRALTYDEIIAEGINGHLKPNEWASWWVGEHGWKPYYRVHNPISWRVWWAKGDQVVALEDVPCRRIEWRYLDEAS
jgi:hypothetical protein